MVQHQFRIIIISSELELYLFKVGKLLRVVERRSVTVRVRRGGATNVTKRDDLTVEPKKTKTNFSFRRVSEVMEGVRLQGMRSGVSRTNLQVVIIITDLFLI